MRTGCTDHAVSTHHTFRSIISEVRDDEDLPQPPPTGTGRSHVLGSEVSATAQTTFRALTADDITPALDAIGHAVQSRGTDLAQVDRCIEALHQVGQAMCLPWSIPDDLPRDTAHWNPRDWAAHLQRLREPSSTRPARTAIPQALQQARDYLTRLQAELGGAGAPDHLPPTPTPAAQRPATAGPRDDVASAAVEFTVPWAEDSPLLSDRRDRLVNSLLALDAFPLAQEALQACLQRWQIEGRTPPGGDTPGPATLDSQGLEPMYGLLDALMSAIAAQASPQQQEVLQAQFITLLKAFSDELPEANRENALQILSDRYDIWQPKSPEPAARPQESISELYARLAQLLAGTVSTHPQFQGATALRTLLGFQVLTLTDGRSFNAFSAPEDATDPQPFHEYQQGDTCTMAAANNLMMQVLGRHSMDLVTVDELSTFLGNGRRDHFSLPEIRQFLRDRRNLHLQETHLIFRHGQLAMSQGESNPRQFALLREAPAALLTLTFASRLGEAEHTVMLSRLDASHFRVVDSASPNVLILNAPDLIAATTEFRRLRGASPQGGGVVEILYLPHNESRR